jgi:endogenous inhibitor of DNA gyrase (YacG/DUF329 family)
MNDNDPAPPRSQAEPAATAAARPCPICGKPAEAKFKPFCSKRCADVDLNRWLTGSYAIPVAEEEVPEEGLPEDDR